MLTAIFSQPRSDGVHSSNILNRILQSLFAARKLNYIIMYIRHYKIFKKQRKLQLYTIHCKSKTNQRETGSSKWLKLCTKIWYLVLTPTEARKMIECWLAGVELTTSRVRAWCSTKWVTGVRCTICLPHAKTSLLPKLWEGFIHPHMDRMNNFFARLVWTGGTLYLRLLHRL